MYKIKKTGKLKFSRLNSVKLFRGHINSYGYNYSIMKCKEILDSMINDTYSKSFDDIFKKGIDVVFNGNEYYNLSEDEVEKNFSDNFIPPVG